VTSSVRARRSARIAAVATGLLLPLLVALPALASNDDGEQPGSSLSTGLVILYYVVIPLGAFLTISFFAMLPSLLRRPRYRPGRPWNHDPLWFNGPEEPNQALTSARPGASAKGGASAEW